MLLLWRKFPLQENYLNLDNYLYLCKYLKIKAIYVTYFHYFGNNRLVLLHENKLFLVW